MTVAADYMRSVLADYGLESLTDWAMDALARGLNENQVLQEMRKTPEFAQRFPAIIIRQEQGLPPLSPAYYIAYERQVAQTLRDAGLPPSFYDQPEDFTALLVADKSAAEVASTIQDGFLRVKMAPPEIRQTFADWFGADGDAALAAFFLDPDKAKPALMRMADQAQIGGYARRFNVTIGADVADQIAASGKTNEAEQAFNALDQGRSLFDETITETNDLTLDQGVQATFSLDGEAQRQVRRRQETRAAQFGGAVTPAMVGEAADYGRRR
jgi:hypothetical protein